MLATAALASALLLAPAMAANEACPVACSIPSGLGFCDGIVAYRSCSSSFAEADALAEAWANASGVLNCEAGRRVACLGHFPACEISTDTRALCLADCQAKLESCGALPTACTAAGSRVASAGDKCFDASYEGEEDDRIKVAQGPQMEAPSRS